MGNADLSRCPISTEDEVTAPEEILMIELAATLVVNPELMASTYNTKSSACCSNEGIGKVKALARSYVWWPNIDAEIEAVVKSCCAYQEIRNEPQKTPTHHWESAKRPWSRLHEDFAGPFQKLAANTTSLSRAAGFSKSIISLPSPAVRQLFKSALHNLLTLGFQ
ncbi:hypothetical protein ACLKA6_000647 [Drosophila palustris]